MYQYFKSVSRPLIGLVLASLCLSSTAKADDMAQCRSLKSDTERLACYDRSSSAATVAPVANQPAVNSVSAAPASATPVTPALASAPPATTRSFGDEALVVKSAASGQQSLTAHVVGSINGLVKGTVLKLDDGQQWKTLDDPSFDYESTNPAVTITRNVLDNYWMNFGDANIRVRVVRVQ